MKFYDGTNWKSGEKTTPSADGLMSKEDKIKLDGSTPSNVVNSIMSRNSSGTSRVQHLYLDGTDPRADQAVRRDWVENALATNGVLRGQGAPTVPVVNEGVYIDTVSGDQYIGVDKGPDPIVNLHTNPSNESPADNAGTEYVNFKNDSFKVIQLNLLYQDLNPSTPGILWEERKPRIANFINSEQPGLMAVEENSAHANGTSLSEVMELVDTKFKSIEFKGSNNGMIYDASVFEVEEVVKQIIPLNKVFVTGGPQRSMTVVRLRHKNMDQRVIFCVIHFVQDPAFIAGRRESIRLCTEFIKEYCKQFSDLPGVIISGDFNESKEDFTNYFAEFGYIPTKIKSPNVTWADQGSYHGFNVNGNTSANWIDDHYTNGVLSVEDTKLGIPQLPMNYSDMLSDHNPVISTMKFKYAKVVQVIGSSGSVTTSANTYQYFSTKWSRSGGGSLAIFPNNSGSSCAYIATLGSDSNSRIGWEVGKTYTVSGYLYIPKTLVGGSGWTRSITIGTVSEGESNNYSYAAADRAPNTPGVHRVSVTFTVPDKDNTFIRVMNGTPNDTVYWDDFMITEGDTLHEYFDGDSPGCYWEGARHYSRSIYPGPSWVKVN